MGHTRTHNIRPSALTLDLNTLFLPLHAPYCTRPLRYRAKLGIRSLTFVASIRGQFRLHHNILTTTEYTQSSR